LEKRTIRDFVLVKEVGAGNASTVWYALCRKTSAPLAVKTYRKRKLSPLNRRQVRMMMRFDDDNDDDD
jgi:aurora kinase